MGQRQSCSEVSRNTRFLQNLDNYLLGIKKDLVNSQAITIDTAFPKELQLISPRLSPKIYIYSQKLIKTQGKRE